MKKKMLFMAALAGLVVLGSCVKDDESASVTAVRNAKAAQLNADATYKQAQAANEQAQAAYNQADAAFRAAQARQQVVAADIAEATKADEIEKLLAQAKRDNAQANQAWQTAINALKGIEMGEINNAITNYNNAVIAYQGAQNDVMAKTAALATAKLNEEQAKEALASNVAGNKRLLAVEEAKLETLESGYAGLSTTEKQEKVNELTQKLTLKEGEFSSSAEVAALLSSAAAYDAANHAVDEFETAMNDLNTFVGNESGWTIGDVFELAWNESIDPTTQEDGSWISFGDYTAFNYTNAAGYSSTFTYTANPEWLKDYRMNEANKLLADRFFADAVENAETPLKNAKDVLGKSTDTKTTKQSDGVTLTLYAELALAQDTLKFWNDSLVKVLALPDTDATKAAKKAEAEGNVTTLKANLRTAEDNVANQLDAINSTGWPIGLQKAYDDAVADKAEYEKLFAAVDLAGATEAVADLKEACEDFNEAADDVYELKVAIDDIADERTAIQGTSAYDIDTQIANVKKTIGDLKKLIADDEQMMANPTYTYEQLVAQAERDLEISKSKLAASEAELKIAKEALEEVIGEFDAETVEEEAEEPAADADADTEG